MVRATPNSGLSWGHPRTDPAAQARRRRVHRASRRVFHRAAGHNPKRPAGRPRCIDMAWNRFDTLKFLCHLLVLAAGLRTLEVICSGAETQVEQTRARFNEAQKYYSAHPDDPEAGWKFGRACFDLADIATGREERADVAQKGIDACRRAIAKDSKSAPSHYYLGLDLGELARTRSFGALKLVDQMEKELSEAARLDAQLDYAGPDRSLGLLYRDAPSFISIGNRGKAREHLRRAVELAPDYPENRLDLIESFLKWDDRTRARKELTALEEALPKAREKFKGAQWTSSWTDWDARLLAVKEKLEEGSKLQSPRH